MPTARAKNDAAGTLGLRRRRGWPELAFPFGHDNSGETVAHDVRHRPAHVHERVDAEERGDPLEWKLVICMLPRQHKHTLSPYTAAPFARSHDTYPNSGR